MSYTLGQNTEGIRNGMRMYLSNERVARRQPLHDIKKTALSPRPDVQHPHHFMVFMRKDVTMPDVATGLGEGCLDAGHRARECRDHIRGCIFDGSFNVVTVRNIAPGDSASNLCAVCACLYSRSTSS